ncbi:hypothetical protein ACWEWX_26380, partial [Streptomyces asiaticus]
RGVREIAVSYSYDKPTVPAGTQGNACDIGIFKQLITLTAEPGTPSHDRLRILASWAARSADHPVADG